MVGNFGQRIRSWTQSSSDSAIKWLLILWLTSILLLVLVMYLGFLPPTIGAMLIIGVVGSILVSGTLCMSGANSFAWIMSTAVGFCISTGLGFAITSRLAI